MSSADDGYSSKQGLEEVQGLGVKVVSTSGAHSHLFKRLKFNI